VPVYVSIDMDVLEPVSSYCQWIENSLHLMIIFQSLQKM
jgi:hypothetical protein